MTQETISKQLTLLGYSYKDGAIILELIALVTHENFYRDVKKVFWVILKVALPIWLGYGKAVQRDTILATRGWVNQPKTNCHTTARALMLPMIAKYS